MSAYYSLSAQRQQHTLGNVTFLRNCANAKGNALLIYSTVETHRQAERATLTPAYRRARGAVTQVEL